MITLDINAEPSGTCRYFVVNPETNEISVEVPAPAGVTLRDVGYGSSPYVAQGVSGLGRFAISGTDVLYILDTDSVNLRVARGGDFSKSVIVDDSQGHQGYKFFGVVSN